MVHRPGPCKIVTEYIRYPASKEHSKDPSDNFGDTVDDDPYNKQHNDHQKRFYRRSDKQIIRK